MPYTPSWFYEKSQMTSFMAGRDSRDGWGMVGGVVVTGGNHPAMLFPASLLFYDKITLPDLIKLCDMFVKL